MKEKLTLVEVALEYADGKLTKEETVEACKQIDIYRPVESDHEFIMMTSGEGNSLFELQSLYHKGKLSRLHLVDMAQIVEDLRKE